MKEFAVSRFHSAKVLDTHDPFGESRLKLHVPEVLGERAVWAWPMVSDRSIRPPKEGVGVWVWFEEDDPSRALWMGVLPR
jgi:hypothetical protein